MRIEWIERLLAWQPPGDYLKYFLNYHSPAYVAPKYPIIGVFNRILQLAVLVYLLVMMGQEKTWAYSDTPLGTVNAFAGATIDNTGDPPLFTQPLEQVSALPYCVNESHAFKYNTQFNYTTPECRYVVPEQLVVKGKGAVDMVTMFLETTFVGWPCSDAAQTAEQGPLCAARGGRQIEHANGQCICESKKTVYPIGVEDMTMSFEHTYGFPDGSYGLKNFFGTSTLTEEEVAKHPTIENYLQSKVELGGHTTGHTKVVDPGQSVSQTVREWLLAAGTSLDEFNELAGFDEEGRDEGKRKPYNRMTGLVISVLISYSNGLPTFYEKRNIHATITATKQLLVWAGPGSERIHVKYPEGSLGAQTFHYIDRYSQGIVFSFEPTGRVYVFDYVYFINSLVSAVVLLGIASTITDAVAFHCLPNGHSAVLSAHRRTKVDKVQGFAELGIRMVNAAAAFSTHFDPDNNEIVEAEDLVRVLARIQCEDLCYKKKDANGQWVDQRFDCEKAHAIAIAILKDQHATGENRANRKSFRFDDYMGTQDNGTIPFTTFLDTVAIPPKGPWAPSEEDKERVKAAWEGAIRQQGNEANAKSERRNKFARMVSTVVASSTFAVSSDNI